MPASRDGVHREIYCGATASLSGAGATTLSVATPTNLGPSLSNTTRITVLLDISYVTQFHGSTFTSFKSVMQIKDPLLSLLEYSLRS